MFSNWQQNVAAVTLEGWAAACRHAKVVEEEYMGREQEMGSVMERITINADDDDNADIQGVGPIVSDSE